MSVFPKAQYSLEEDSSLNRDSDLTISSNVNGYLGIVVSSGNGYIKIARASDVNRGSAKAKTKVNYTVYNTTAPIATTAGSWVAVVYNKKARISSNGRPNVTGTDNGVKIIPAEQLPASVLAYLGNGIISKSVASVVTDEDIRQMDSQFSTDTTGYGGTTMFSSASNPFIKESHTASLTNLTKVKAFDGMVGKLCSMIGTTTYDESKAKSFLKGYTPGALEKAAAELKAQDNLWRASAIPYIPSAKEFESMLLPGYTRIGYSAFMLPPGQISYVRQQPSNSVPLLRANNSLNMGYGNSAREFTINFTFDSVEDINSGLLSLVRQFQRTPFVPIANDYINNTLECDALALEAIQLSTCPSMPNCIEATLQCSEFNWKGYLPGEESFESTICYPLYKIWCETNTRTEPIDTEGMTGEVGFYIPSANHLKELEEEESLKYTKATAANLQKKDLSVADIATSYAKGGPSAQKIYMDYGVENQMTSENISVGSGYRPEGDVFVGKITVPGFCTNTKCAVFRIADLANASSLLSEFNKAKSIGTAPGCVLYGSVVISQATAFDTIKMTGSVLKGDDLNSKCSKLTNVINTRDRYTINADYEDVASFLKDAYFVLPVGNTYLLEAMKKRYTDSHRDDTSAQTTAKAANGIAASDPATTSSGAQWQAITFDSMVVESVALASENILTVIQPSLYESPLHQFLGRSDTHIVIRGTITNEFDVLKLKAMLDKVEYMTRRFGGTVIGSTYEGYMYFKNEIAKLMGVTRVLPLKCEINTVPDYPSEWKFELTMVAFDPMMKRREELTALDDTDWYVSDIYNATNGKLQTTTSDYMDNLIRADYAHTKLRSLELYPDMKLPTYKQLAWWIRLCKKGKVPTVLGLDSTKWPWTAAYFDEITAPKSTTTYVEPDFYSVASYPNGQEFIDGTIATCFGNGSEQSGVANEKHRWDIYSDIGITDKSGNVSSERGYQYFGEDMKIGHVDDDGTVKVDSATSSISSAHSNIKELVPTSKSSVSVSSAGTAPAVSDDGSSGVIGSAYEVVKWMKKNGVSKSECESIITYAVSKSVPVGILARALVRGQLSSTSSTLGLGRLSSSILSFINKQIVSGATTPWDASSVKPSDLTINSHAIWMAAVYLRLCYTQLASFIKKNKISLEANQLWAVAILSYRAGISKVETALGTFGYGTVIFDMSSIGLSSTDKGFFTSVLAGHDETATAYTNAIKKVYSSTSSAGESTTSTKVSAPGGLAELIQTKADKYGLNANIVAALVKTESSFNPNAKSQYSTAAGLCQLLQNTASSLGVSNVYDPEQNLDGGCKYLKQKLDKYGNYSQALAAYNQGDGNYDSKAGKRYAAKVMGYATDGSVANIDLATTSNTSDSGTSDSDTSIGDGPTSLTVSEAFYNSETKQDMFYDLRNYSGHGRLVQAFPSYCMLLVDGGRWLRFWRLWDHFYGMSAIQSIEVFKSRKSPTDVAVVKFANMYGHLTKTSAENPGGLDNKYRWGLPFVIDGVMENFFGSPNADVVKKWSEHVNSLMLKAGARMHIRMGYGSNANNLPVVFNGVISEVPPAQEIVEVVALGDGCELQKNLDTNAKDSSGTDVYRSHTFFGMGVNPREIILRILAPYNFTATWTAGGYCHDNPHGIEHFGSPRYHYGWVESYECGVNVFNVSMQSVTEDKTASDSSVAASWLQSLVSILNLDWFADNESRNKIGISMENATAWDVFTTCARTAPDYIVATHPFEFRSTLFYGKPHWPLKFAYTLEYLNATELSDVYNGSGDMEVSESSESSVALSKLVDAANVIVSDFQSTGPYKYMQWKPYSQVKIISSSLNLISNKMKASSENIYTKCRALGSYNGPLTKDSQNNDRSDIMNIDTDIYQENQKLLVTTSGLYTTWMQSLQNASANTTLNDLLFGSKVLNVYAAQTLKESVKDMYDGSCVIMGDPSIKPYDRVFFSDVQAEMGGVFEVKEVTHHFSFENGMTSTVKPDLVASLVTTDDQMGWGWVQSFGARLVGAYGLRSMLGSVLGKLNAHSGVYTLVSTYLLLKKQADKNIPWAREALSEFTKVIANRLPALVKSYGSVAKLVEAITTDASAQNDYVTACKKQYSNIIKDLKYNSCFSVEATDHMSTMWKSLLNSINAQGFISLCQSIGSKIISDGKLFKITAFSKPLSQISITDVLGRSSKSSISLPYLSKRVGWVILADSVAELLDRKLFAKQCLVMRPLRIANKNFIAGIDGHAGCIYGDTCSYWDGVIASFTNYKYQQANGVGVFGNDYGAGGFINLAKGLTATLCYLSGADYQPFEYKDSVTIRREHFSDDEIRDATEYYDQAVKDTESYMNSSVIGDDYMSSPEAGKNIVSTAKSYIGKITYSFGSDTATEKDCSSFVRFVFKQYGVTLPRTAKAQASCGKAVSSSALLPGDTVHIAYKGGDIDHVFIYAGNNYIVENCPYVGGVAYRKFPDSYKKCIKACRRHVS